MASKMMLPKAMVDRRLTQPESAFTLSTSASTGSSTDSDSEETIAPQFFKSLPFERPALMTIKNTFLEFYTEEVSVSPFQFRRVKSSPDIFYCSDQDNIIVAEEMKRRITVGVAYAGTTSCASEVGEMAIQDTFRKFGWPVSAGQVFSGPSEGPVTSSSWPQMIPPPPAAPPRLSSTRCQRSYAAVTAGIPSKSSRQNSQIREPSSHQEVEEETLRQQPIQLRSVERNCASELGSAALPTAGSARHWQRRCKPCVFFHKKGCENGVACEFCHLCDAGEKQRRQKEKQARLQIRMHRTLRKECAKSW